MSTHYVRASGTYQVTLPRETSRDDRISYRALGVLCRLLGNAEGFDMPSAALARGECREGRDAIRAALSELESAGYLVRVHIRDVAAGRWTGQTVLYFDTPGHTPDECGDFQAPAFQATGNPVAGKPALKSSRNKNTYRRKSSSSSSEHPAAASKLDSVHSVPEPTQRTAGHTPDAAPRAGKQIHRPTGAWYRDADDIERISEMSARFGGVAAVAEAVSAIINADDTPWPSVIEPWLMSRRRRERAAAAAQDAHVAAVPPALTDAQRAAAEPAARAALESIARTLHATRS